MPNAKSHLQKGSLWQVIALFLRQWKILLIAAVFTCIQCVAQLQLPQLMAEIVDRGISMGNLHPVGQYARHMLVVCLVLGVCGYLTRLLATIGSSRFALELRQDLYDRICQMSVQQADTFGSGSLITRLVTDVQVCASLMNVIMQLMFEPVLLLVGGTIMVWQTEPRLGIIFLGFILLQLGMMVIFVYQSAPLFQRVRMLTDGLNRTLQAVFIRLRLIKLSSTEGVESEGFSKLNEELVATGLSVQKIVSIFQPATMLIMDLAVAAVLLFAESGVDNMPMGKIMKTLSYTQQILLAVVISGQLFRYLTEATPSASRIQEVLHCPQTMLDGEQPLSTPFETLAVQGASFAYADTGNVLQDLSISVQRGEFLAITGTVGCGKSTLAALFARLCDPQSGTVTRNDTPLTDLPMEQVRRRLALVEKGAAIVSGTFRDNLTFGREGISEEDLDKATGAAQCHALVESLPNGYDSPVASLDRFLSGGECQRLAIARALAGGPDVLILDDATCSLDYGTEFDLFQAIRESYPSLTIILFTQRAASASKADRIAYMENGKITQMGNRDEMYETCAPYRQMFYLQKAGEIHAS